MSEPFDVAPHLDDIADLVRRASRLSLRWYRRLDRIDNKLADGFDPVTEADRAVERELRDRLAERFPDHAILGEEYGETGDGPHRWTIDPIDGTRAFITGQPMWGTLLGFQVDGRPVAGWMHLPVLDETFVGHGASTRLRTADGAVTELSVSAVERVDEAVVLSTHPDMFAAGSEADRWAEVAAAAKLVRYSGDCVNYGLLAMGLADAVVENGLATYDIVPLLPIIEGAGGRVTDLRGEPPLEGGYVVAAATEALHRELLDRLA